MYCAAQIWKIHHNSLIIPEHCLQNCEDEIKQIVEFSKSHQRIQ